MVEKLVYKAWYNTRPEFTFPMRAMPDTREELEERFKLVKEVKAHSLEKVYYHMQGEIWSPNGEAKPIIERLGLRHTSMSVSDIIETPDGIFWMVMNEGFKSIPFTKEDLGTTLCHRCGRSTKTGGVHLKIISKNNPKVNFFKIYCQSCRTLVKEDSFIGCRIETVTEWGTEEEA
jgi:hypothetical protein